MIKKLCEFLFSFFFCDAWIKRVSMLPMSTCFSPAAKCPKMTQINIVSYKFFLLFFFIVLYLHFYFLFSSPDLLYVNKSMTILDKSMNKIDVKSISNDEFSARKKEYVIEIVSLSFCLFFKWTFFFSVIINRLLTVE